MTDKQIMIDEKEINPNDRLEPYKPIPACEIKDCEHWVYAGNNIYGCRIAEDGLVCDDFNNADECCMYRQLEYYKEALKAKEQECKRLEVEAAQWESAFTLDTKLLDKEEARANKLEQQLDQLKAENERLKKGIFKLDKTQPQVILTDGQVSLMYCTFLDMEFKTTKLKETLTEVKEISEIEIECKTYEVENDCFNGTRCKALNEHIAFLKQILEKISEVENE